MFYDRLVDDKDRSWFLAYVRSVMKDRLAADFDKLFAHLRPAEAPGGEVTIEDVRKCFFGDYMDGNGECWIKVDGYTTCLCPANLLAANQVCIPYRLCSPQTVPRSVCTTHGHSRPLWQMPLACLQAF